MGAQGEAPEGGDDRDWLTTGDMARLSQTTLRTVRFYEAEGLITSMARGDGSHRRFPQSELRKLQIISDLRESGLSLKEIRELIALKGNHASPLQAASAATRSLCAQADELERRIQTLTRVRDELLSTVSTLRTCHECTHPGFPQRCHECDVVSQPGSSRAMHLFWTN